MKLTIKEIAAMAGVSKASVSYVMNGKGSVGETTRKKILEIIKETNYTPNQNSRRLSNGKNYMITVASPDETSPFDNLFYLDITKAVLEKCKECGYSLSICSLSDDDKIPPEFLGGSTDGVIFFQSGALNILHELERQKVPFVIADAYNAEPRHTTITTDNEFFTETALKYLISKGHTDIALITSQYLPEYYFQTCNAYRHVISEINQNIPIEWIQSEAADEASAYECMARIIDSEHIPTAVFCADDIFAVGAIKCASERGYKIPDYISFMGIDDILISSYINPPLTTINIDKKEMGYISFDLLFSMMKGETAESVKIKTYKLMERASVKDIRIK
ncbi:MAG: LacI family transcriptional regulator [Oscillospiraceae bacterium]|nr:LacI family transcriptional regulator [Oscillospiraceae bacterium]